MNENAPDEYPPPRVVTDTTSVRGHVLTRGPKPICSCNWRDSSGAPDAAAIHLQDAWPILLTRDQGEAPEAFRHRVAIAHGEALEEAHRLEMLHGLNKPIEPGQAFPIEPEEYSDAAARVEVLTHQLQELILKQTP